MSELWTPSGEGEASSQAGPADPRAAPEQEQEAAARAELDRVRAELAGTPVRDLVANHAIGLWQLAILHLGLDRPTTLAPSEANLAEAKLAIDAMAALIEGLMDRLGDHAEPLKDALTSLRLAYVRVSGDAGSAPTIDDRAK